MRSNCERRSFSMPHRPDPERLRYTLAALQAFAPTRREHVSKPVLSGVSTANGHGITRTKTSRTMLLFFAPRIAYPCSTSTSRSTNSSLPSGAIVSASRMVTV